MSRYNTRDEQTKSAAIAPSIVRDRAITLATTAANLHARTADVSRPTVGGGPGVMSGWTGEGRGAGGRGDVPGLHVASRVVSLSAAER